MRPAHRNERGSALLVAVAMSLVLLTLVIALFAFAGSERSRAIRMSRQLNRSSCVQSGLLLARQYFSANVANWNNYLANPAVYDPVVASWQAAAGKTAATPQDFNPGDATYPANPQLFPDHKELFYDLDGDNKMDVYIYIRDNQDEFTTADNWMQDNDQNVIIGAVCISSTLAPRLPNGQLDTSPLTAESLLSYNTPNGTYTAQAGGGASGTGNMN